MTLMKVIFSIMKCGERPLIFHLFVCIVRKLYALDSYIVWKSMRKAKVLNVVSTILFKSRVVSKLMQLTKCCALYLSRPNVSENFSGVHTFFEAPYLFDVQSK